MAKLEGGREGFRRRAWGHAYLELSGANEDTLLEPADLERLAVAAYLTGRDAESEQAWARAHEQCLRRGDAAGAARCAFWLAFGLVNRGETVRAGGWLARAGRLLDDHQLDCVEQGYLLGMAAMQVARSRAARRLPEARKRLRSLPRLPLQSSESRQGRSIYPHPAEE
jgi:hypothetical protein